MMAKTVGSFSRVNDIFDGICRFLLAKDNIASSYVA